MKKTLCISLSILLVLGALPLVLGFYLQKQYSVVLNTLCDSTNLSVKLTAYKRSWLHSDATLISSVPLIDQPLSNETVFSGAVLPLKQHIYHGPFIVSKEGIKFAAYQIDTYYENTKLSSTVLTPMGHLVTKIIIPSWVVMGENKHPKFTIVGAYANIDWNLHSNQMNGSIKLHQLASNIGEPRVIDSYIARFILEKTSGGLWIGTKTHHFDRISWKKAENQFEIKNLDYFVNSVVHEGLFDARIEAKVSDLKSNQHDYSAQRVAISFKNFNQQAIEQFHDQFPLTKAHLLNPLEFKRAQQQLVSILHQGGAIIINPLCLNTTWGQVNAVANVNYPLPTYHSLEQVRINAALPSELISKLLTDFYVLKLRTNDDVLVKKEVEQLLTTWQKEGWLNFSGSGAQFHYQRH